ncbi:MAG: hypothetical protein WD489_03970 [Rhodovibrionaceae bacterium]
MDSTAAFGISMPLDLALAAAGGLLIGFGGAQLSGFYPLGRMVPTAPGKLMAIATTALLAVMALLLLGFVVVATSWAPALIAAGLALLAGPLVFQALPPRFAAAAPGLAASLLLAAVLSVLFLQRLTA